MIKTIIIIIIVINLIAVGSYLFLNKPPATDDLVFTSTTLAQFDGSDPAQPIYLALDGLVYDVTAGREYYDSSGRYHDLAGKDSSAMLHIAGAGIIKVKYPIIGRLTP